MKKLIHLFLALSLATTLVGCKGEHNHDGHEHGHDHPTHSASPSADKPAEHEHEHKGHHHEAPHGGALVVLGEEFVHLEFTLDQESGTLTAYVLDGEAQNAVRLPVSELELDLSHKGKVSLSGVADELTGETANDTSTFRVQTDLLKGVDSFQATLPMIEVKGQSFKDVTFGFPEGNEGDHEHGDGGDHEHHDDHDHDEHEGDHEEGDHDH